MTSSSDVMTTIYNHQSVICLLGNINNHRIYTQAKHDFNLEFKLMSVIIDIAVNIYPTTNTSLIDIIDKYRSSIDIFQKHAKGADRI